MVESRRQLYQALGALFLIMVIGVVGFMLTEGWLLEEAIYATVVTLSTVGYGDVVPRTLEGRYFAVFLLLVGISSFAFAAQAAFGIIANPRRVEIAQRARTRKKIRKLHRHYIICGKGELVDRCTNLLLQASEVRRRNVQARRYAPIDRFLDRIFGDDADGHHLWLRKPLKRLIHKLLGLFKSPITFLDVLVVVTHDKAYADYLRETGLLVIQGDPTEDATLHHAGIMQARALMVLMENDTENLMAVLTAHTVNPSLSITVAVMDETLSRNMLRVGATTVINPYERAGQFMNNATLRPSVNRFFDSILFDFETPYIMMQLDLLDDSPWIGQTLGALGLDEQFGARVLGLRADDGDFVYTPSTERVLNAEETLIVVALSQHMDALRRACRGYAGLSKRVPIWQALPLMSKPPESRLSYTLAAAQQAVEGLSNHFIIAGDGPLARNAIMMLNPERPFVLVSHRDEITQKLLERGFRVIHGDPTHEDTLRRAGIQRAQAIMVAMDDRAQAVLTTLNSRSLNKDILITTAAHTDEMIDKLERAGADRVVSPFVVAASFVLLSTTRAEVANFLDFIVYNYSSGLETTELYMETTSPWIGQQLGTLGLEATYQAGVLGIWHRTTEAYTYAPAADYVIQAHDVLIVVTPMQHNDTLRCLAYGNEGQQADTLRRNEDVAYTTNVWTRDMLKELIEQHTGEV